MAFSTCLSSFIFFVSIHFLCSVMNWSFVETKVKYEQVCVLILNFQILVVEKMDNVTGGMETSRQTYDDKLTAVESDLKKLGNLQQK